MKLNLLKISVLFFVLLIIVPTIFIATSDFVVAKPLGLPTVDLIEISKEVSEADERISPIIRSLFHVVNVLLIFLIISLIILNWAAGVGMYIGLGSLGYVFYDIGYAWSLGILNMLFVIAFVFAALLYILDVEWGIVDKKTLPRLVIVALLINFSSLFVKIIIDFFIIFERGVLEQLLPGGLFIPLRTIGIQSILNWFALVLLPYIRLIITELVATIVGFFAFGITSFLLTIKQYVAAPIIITPFVMEIISNFLLFAVFSIYAVLFFARSIIIGWYLMLAPVAIACTVFPKTRSFFDSWLKQLLLWGAMGTILFIVLSFGFHIRSFIAGGFNIALTKGFGVGVGGIMIFVANFFFAIYSIVSFFMIKKYLPSAAQGGIDMLQKGAMLAGGLAAGAVGGAAWFKYGGGIKDKLGKISESLGGRTTFAGGIVADLEQGVGDQLEKEKAKKRSGYLGYSKDRKEKELIELVRQGRNEEAAILLGTLAKDLSAEDLKKYGIRDREHLIEIVGEEKAEEHYKHFRKAENIKESTKTIQDNEAEMKIIEGIESSGGILTPDQIKTKEEVKKAKAKIHDIFNKSSSEHIKEIMGAIPEMMNNIILQEFIGATGDVSKISHFCGNDPDKANTMLTNLADKYTLKHGYSVGASGFRFAGMSSEQKRAFIKKNRALLNFLGRQPNSNINDSDVNSYCDDDFVPGSPEAIALENRMTEEIARGTTI